MNSTHSSNGRVRILVPFAIRPRFREDVAAGLSRRQKSIAPMYFYDHAGSLLFEQICRQPEYYLTRTETAILTKHAADIVDEVGECTIVELGSGSSVKTRLLLDECHRRGHHIQRHWFPFLKLVAVSTATSSHCTAPEPASPAGGPTWSNEMRACGARNCQPIAVAPCAGPPLAPRGCDARG